jgi:hypothetical protein
MQRRGRALMDLLTKSALCAVHNRLASSEFNAPCRSYHGICALQICATDTREGLRKPHRKYIEHLLRYRGEIMDG